MQVQRKRWKVGGMEGGETDVGRGGKSERGEREKEEGRENREGGVRRQ